MNVRLHIIVFILTVVCASGAAAQNRSLYWSDLDVEATLDKSGVLHVSEKQSMVFDGAWNGGERRFHVADGQTFQFLALEEIDPESGAVTPFREGNLDNTGSFGWHARTTLRWRARGATDPAFIATKKIYVLRYTVSRVVQKRGDRYRLNHDFAFRDRPGVIERFTLNLTLDPVWQPAAPFDMPITRTALQPGSSVVVTVPLRYTGSGTPEVRDLDGQTASTIEPPSRLSRMLGASTPGRVRTALSILVVTVLLGHLIFFYRDERRRGRFAAIDDVNTIDRSWLEQYVFSYKPEVIGAAWDQKIGGPEVAAMLARLELEGVISSHVETTKFFGFTKRVLHMKQLRSFYDLPSHERWLLEALFAGQQETDTVRIGRIYKSQGFNPVSGITDSLERARPWAKVPERKAEASRAWRSFAITIICAFVIFVLTIVAGELDDTAALLGTGPAAVLCLPFLVPLARASSRNDAHPYASQLLWLAPFTAAVALVCTNVFSAYGMHPLTLFAVAAMMITAARVILHFASTEGAEERIAARKKLFAARRYFKRELQRSDPKLEDRWLPYLIAFGLQRQVARWSRAFAVSGAATSVGDSSSTFDSGSGGTFSSVSSGWSGGGGSFGGAGATGGWASAVGAMAAGVSAPSSSGGSDSSGGSSSSDSGGGGGGDSGGGGGGGW